MRRGGIYSEYTLKMREILRADPKGFPNGSGYISPYMAGFTQGG